MYFYVSDVKGNLSANPNMPKMQAVGDEKQRGFWRGKHSSKYYDDRRRPWPGGGRARSAICGPGRTAAEQNFAMRGSQTGGNLYHKCGKVPSTQKPSSTAGGMQRMYELFKGTSGADSAEDHRVSG